jgi:glycerol-3-phosphate dehydrogenase
MGDVDDQRSAGVGDAVDLRNKPAIVVHVLEHINDDDLMERMVVKRQRPAVGLMDVVTYHASNRGDRGFVHVRTAPLTSRLPKKIADDTVVGPEIQRSVNGRQHGFDGPPLVLFQDGLSEQRKRQLLGIGVHFRIVPSCGMYAHVRQREVGAIAKGRMACEAIGRTERCCENRTTVMMRRPNDLVDREFDLLVVGGGSHGAAIARDAALRGLSVALIDRGDFGAETSAQSLRIIHGGLRYLQQLNLVRVRRSICERSAWLRTAPHLVHPLACMTATRAGMTRGSMAFRAAFLLNDMIGLDRNRGVADSRRIMPCKVVSKHDARSSLIGRDVETATGGAVWYDAQAYHSERLTLAMVRNAVQHGAVAINYCEARLLSIRNRKVVGADVVDGNSGDSGDSNDSGDTFEIRAKMTVLACGTGSNSIVDRSLGRCGQRPQYPLAKGINVLLPKMAGDVAIAVPVIRTDRQQGRMLFVTPWRDRSLVGTAYFPYISSTGQHDVSDQELESFIQEINQAVPNAELSTSDVLAVQSGVIPVRSFVDGSGTDPVFHDRTIVVEHRVEDRLGGLISVVGVKYTTARSAAEDVVSRVADELGGSLNSCSTADLPLQGGDFADYESFEKDSVDRFGERLQIASIRELVWLYGTDIAEIIGECADGVNNTLTRDDVLTKQVRFAVDHEMAIKLADVVFRRTDLISRGHPGRGPIELAAGVLANRLNWTSDRQQSELADVREQMRRMRITE